jgi:hypothetical protein
MFIVSHHRMKPAKPRGILAVLVGALVLAQAPMSGLASPVDSSRLTVKVSIPFQRRSFKVSNDVLVVFQRNWADKTKENVELFDRAGERVASLSPLTSVQDAEAMSIWDVAVGRTGPVAMAAVFQDSEGRHAACLLLYDTTGRLLHALNLAPERMIRRLDVDEEGNTWALGETSGVEDPALTPAVFEYDREGKLVGQYVHVVELPPIVADNEERGSGPDALGLTRDGVWLWVPERRALVTFHRDGTHVEIRNIGAPAWTLPAGAVDHIEVVFGGFCALSGGAYVAQATLLAPSSAYSDIYVWREAGGRWKPLLRAGQGGVLVGADADLMVLGRAKPDGPEIEFQWVDVPED